MQTEYCSVCLGFCISWWLKQTEALSRNIVIINLSTTTYIAFNIQYISNYPD